MSQWMLSAAAVLGAVQVFTNWQAAMLSFARAHVSSSAASTLNVVEGDRISFPVTVTNTSTNAGNRLMVRAAPLSPLAVSPEGPGAPVLAIDVTKAVGKPLSPGESHTFDVTGVAERPGTYSVAMRMTAKAGWMAPGHDLAHTQSVLVWPALHVETDSAKVAVDSGRSLPVTIRARVGRFLESGLRGSVEVAKRPEIRIGSVTSRVRIVSSSQLESVAGTPTDQFRVGHEWRTGPIPAFSIAEFKVVLTTTGAGLGSSEWREVLDTMEVDLAPAKGAGK